MRTAKLIPALALAAALTVPAASAAPANASAVSTSCRVEFYDLDAINVAESDGQDELRLRVDGYLYPTGNDWVPMQAGDDADPDDFDDVGVTAGTTGIVSFSLREVTPPAAGSGTSLGYIYAYNSTCATLTRGETYTFVERITGTDETYYAYDIKVRMTGL